MRPLPDQEAVVLYREKITDEIFKAFGLSGCGALRRWLGPLFRFPAGRFGGVIARFDEEIRSSGLSGGCRRLLADLRLRVTARGTERIPVDGPLLLVSNHPGAYDSIAIMASVPRQDLKVILSDVPFTRAFAAGRTHFIFAPLNAAGRATALRASMDHLQSGGALLLFPHDEVEPDPETSPGAMAAIRDWSHSIEIILRRVPETRLQVTMASGILMPRFLHHPLVKIRKSAAKRQKLAEFLQVIGQMVFPRSVRPCIHLSFAEPVVGLNILDGDPIAAVREAAGRLLEEHLAFFNGSR
ncbi:MAG: 1-acyl-sn-glycerol-3-phosphate acyltransferase [Candidatus Aminicenantes bacterium]|nr:1-acyl-sn-glycerol-3-phosphate acyltransferase [Candidatus Aminicenantes bacterium]